MDATLDAVKGSSLLIKPPVTSPFSYRVVCERCHNTVFFLGEDDVEPVFIICAKCTLGD